MSGAEGPTRHLRVNSELAIPLAEITLRTSRSSGPGGQHANVTASRVEAIFDVLASPSLSETQRERMLTRSGPRIVAVA
ncbi:MAG: Class peptide chain release factor, partial [Solirubrobacterales bacterium]|nr:Class peptide chain release factor [Solirubrobacterales bacterium]